MRSGFRGENRDFYKNIQAQLRLYLLFFIRGTFERGCRIFLFFWCRQVNKFTTYLVLKGYRSTQMSHCEYPPWNMRYKSKFYSTTPALSFKPKCITVSQQKQAGRWRLVLPLVLQKNSFFSPSKCLLWLLNCYHVEWW